MIIFYRKNFYTNILEKMIKEDRVTVGKEFNFLNHLVSLGIIKYEKDYEYKHFGPQPSYYISDKYLDDAIGQLGIFIRSSKICDLKDSS